MAISPLWIKLTVTISPTTRLAWNLLARNNSSVMIVDQMDVYDILDGAWINATVHYHHCTRSDTVRNVDLPPERHDLKRERESTVVVIQ